MTAENWYFLIPWITGTAEIEIGYLIDVEQYISIDSFNYLYTEKNISFCSHALVLEYNKLFRR